mmetsp:Transcript_14208/g.37705  ORF Transcript_14208/g.37705 Transcript_14208/m.37705 type:complete len:505 (-) Transcript_14208:62-1576(-)
MSSFILINFSRARGGSGLVGHSRFGLVARFGLVWRGFPLLCWLVLVLSNVICSARSVSAARRSASAFSVPSVNTRNEQISTSLSRSKPMVSRSKGSGGGAAVVPPSMISQLSSATTAAFDLDDYEKEEDNEHTTTVVQTTVSVSSDQRHSKQGGHNAAGKHYEHWPEYDIALRFAHHSSVAYCHDDTSLLAWNCSRCSFAPSFVPTPPNGTATNMQRWPWPHRGREPPPPPPPPPNQQGDATFRTDEAIYDSIRNVFGYTGEYQGAIRPGGRSHPVVVSFRGTQSTSLRNWISDLRFFRLDFDWPVVNITNGTAGMRVHSGFFHAWNATQLKPNVTQSVVKMLNASVPTDSRELHITGHSLGAAIATFCAVDLATMLASIPGFEHVPVYLWTYGSPRVGNAKFALFVEKLLSHRSMRMTHHKDIVPSLPPEYLGFHHVSREVWQHPMQLPPISPTITSRTIYEICDGSGEDLACHDGQCLMGLCHSVSDHLMYFNQVQLSGGSC